MVNKKILILLTLTFIFISFGVIYSNNVSPKGDEVHYLITATSITKDHDLWLENNYPENLDRHTVKEPDGHEYLYHGLGLFPFLMSPGFLIFGRMGAVFTNTILSILLILQIFYFTKEVTKSSKISLLTTTALSLNLPLVNFYVLIFPEIAGSLLILTSIRLLFKKTYNSILIYLCISLLPWIHLRFLPVSVLLFLSSVYKLKNNNKKLHFLIYIFPLVSYFIFLYIIYGSINPLKPYQDLGINTGGANILVNFINILIDRQYGLLTYTPLYIFAIPGFYLWLGQDRRQVLFILAILLTYLIPVLHYTDWHGGYAPPARYLVSIVPILIPAVSLFLQNRRNIYISVISYLFFVWGLLAFILNLTHLPDNGFIYQDGFSPFLIQLNSFVGFNIHKLFPAFYPTQQLSILHLIWLIIIVSFIYLITRSRDVNREILQ